jgi:WD40 repeat protein
VTFDGFISYSHAADGRLAPALQRGLHRLAKPWHRRRALWIFRDHTGLSVTPALWSSIQSALDESEYFVLLASPEAARSEWVNKEIQHWVATKSPDRILPVVTNGEWRWDRARGDFAEDASAVPAALRGVLAEEPLYLDLRWARDAGQLTLRDPRFRDAVAQLAAPMHGMSKDELEGEDVQQHRRARRLWSGGVVGLTVLALLAAATGVIAVRNAHEARTATAEAGVQQARAAQQEKAAGKSATEAQAQMRHAEDARARARQASAEAAREAKRAQQQRVLANRASVEVMRQQANARRQEQIAREQQQVAREARQWAQEQETFAKQQTAAAKEAAAESAEQKRIAAKQARLADEAKKIAQQQLKIADQQRRLAEQAKAQAEMQSRIAGEQKKLAEAAEAEASRQQRIALEQQHIAEQEAAKAAKEKATADEQQRIAIGRRLFTEAQNLTDRDMATALQLGIAATKLQLGDDAQGRLAGMVTSTRYAGPMPAKNVKYVKNDVVLGVDDELTLWSVADRALPKELSRLGSYQHWDVSADGGTVVAAKTGDPYAVVFDIADPAAPEMVGQIPVEYHVSDVTFSQTGRKLFIGTSELRLREGGSLWDLSNPRSPAMLAKQIGTAAGKVIDFAAFNSDGTLLATHAVGGKTGLWDLSNPASPKLIGLLDAVIGNEPVGALAFLPTKPELVVGGTRQTYFLDVSAQAVPQTAETFLNAGGMVTSIAFNPDASRMLIAEGNGAVISAIRAGELGLARSATGRERVATLSEAAPTIALSPDSRTFIAGGAQWNTASYAAPASVAKLGETHHGLAAAFTPDDGHVVTVGQRGRAVLWAVPPGAQPEPRAEILVADNWISQAAITPDARIVAAGDQFTPIRVTNIADPTHPVPVAEIPETDLWNQNGDELLISPDGATVAVGNSRTGDFELWDVSAPGTPRRLEPLADSRLPVSFGPGGRLVSAAKSSKTAALLWTLAGPSGPARTGKISGPRGTPIGDLALSPDGNTLAVAQGRYSSIWNVATAEKPKSVSRFAEDLGTTDTLTFSRDGSTIVGRDWENDSFSSWNLAGGTRPILMAVADADLTRQRATAMTQDGRLVLIGGAGDEGGSQRSELWSFDATKALFADPTVQACAMAGASPTYDKWSTYLPELEFQQVCPVSGESVGDVPPAGASNNAAAPNAGTRCRVRWVHDYLDTTNRYGAAAWCEGGGYLHVSVRCISEKTGRYYTVNGSRIWSLSSSDLSVAYCRPIDAVGSVTVMD